MNNPSRSPEMNEMLQQYSIWAENGPENFEHQYLLMKAEQARINDNLREAILLYRQSQESANKHGFIQNFALANELAASFYASLGSEKAKEVHLKEANYHYMVWGAKAKVQYLETNYGAWLQPSTYQKTGTTTTTSETVAATIDLNTVIKISRSITGELVREKLVRRLLSYVLENAGAQKGYLINENNGKLYAEAHGSIDGDTIVQSELLTDRDVSLAIVRYVARTQQYISLGDATQEGAYIDDPHISLTRPKSILCIPIIYHARLKAILYLENNLVANAFTDDRLNFLEIIAAQVAIALENADLFFNLEQKVVERTQELKQKNEELIKTRDQLIVQEKMASMGTLTSGIAHELKNPLNFVNNFSVMLLTLRDDLKEVLEENPEDLQTINEIMDEFSYMTQKVHVHGVRANQIVENMQAIGAPDNSTIRPIKLNSLIQEFTKIAHSGFQSKYPNTAIELTYQLSPQIEHISASPQNMSRVFVNLTQNALEAILEKQQNPDINQQGMVTISTKQTDQHVKITFQDNGCGIPKKNLKQIYVPFFTTKPTNNGNIGLGLSICYDIIYKEHKGKMEVSSEPKVGTSVTLTLPTNLK